jgi:hypothetical protein
MAFVSESIWFRVPRLASEIGSPLLHIVATIDQKFHTVALLETHCTMEHAFYKGGWRSVSASCVAPGRGSTETGALRALCILNIEILKRENRRFDPFRFRRVFHS